MPAELRDERYRMPVVFGPSAGPRIGPQGQRFDLSASPREVTTIAFLTDKERLLRLIPDECELDGEPVVTVQHTVLKELEWLAGRGYSMLGVRYPVRFRGKVDDVHGSFLAILWENMPEPILTGREEIGFAKLYCELPPPRVAFDRRDVSASWDGHEFMRMSVTELSPIDPPPPPPDHFEGLIHQRYFPKVSAIGQSDVDEIVLSPQRNIKTTYDWVKAGRGEIAFIGATWEQMPTMYHIANVLAALPVLEPRGASVMLCRGGSDYFDQRVLR